MTAAVWKTVRGRWATEGSQGALKAAVTALWERMSVGCYWMYGTRETGAVSMSLRWGLRMLRMRMEWGGVPRARSWRTMKPPTRPVEG